MRGSAAAAAAAEEAAAREDEVRLLAAEGRLASELSRYPIFAVPGTQSALVFRSWADEDDAECQARERMAVLELSHTAANLREIQELIGVHVEASQGALDAVEQNMAQARDDTEQVVAFLSKTGEARVDRLKWLAPSLCLVVLGGAAFAGAPAACISCFAVRGAAVAGATLATGTGSLGIAEWQKRTLEAVAGQLPRAFARLPEATALMLRAVGDEAERRLLAKLADQPSWTRRTDSLVGWNKSLPLWERGSDTRADGHAYATFFEVDLPASRIFQALQRLSVAGSLDPGCEVCWSCPVDDVGETQMRYLVFSKWAQNRQFYCACRCARARVGRSLSSDSLGTGQTQGLGLPKYIFAVISVSADLLEDSELPCPQPDISRGHIYACGVSITQLESGGSSVEVMADVDPNLPRIPTMVVDRDVRLHVLYTAEKLSGELRQAQVAETRAEMDAMQTSDA